MVSLVKPAALKVSPVATTRRRSSASTAISALMAFALTGCSYLAEPMAKSAAQSKISSVMKITTTTPTHIMGGRSSTALAGRPAMTGFAGSAALKTTCAAETSPSSSARATSCAPTAAAKSVAVWASSAAKKLRVTTTTIMA